MGLVLAWRDRIRAALRPMDMARPAETIDPADPEARDWLAAGGSGMANERFDEPADVVEFVDELYAAGATRVVFAADSIRDDGFATVFKVALPAGRKQRRAVLAIVNREVREEGFDEIVDEGQPAVLLWWD